MQGLKHISSPELTAVDACLHSRNLLPDQEKEQGRKRKKKKLNTALRKRRGKPGTASNDSFGRMIEVAVGSLPSNMSLEESAVRDMAGSETDCSEARDEVVLGRIASSPLDPFPPRDFRGKFKKMRHKKRPTILESRYFSDCL